MWRASTPDHIRCSSYALFKHVRILEPYLSKLGTSNIIYLAQFRCRSNKLPISKLYKPELFYDTTCTLCTKNETGNEFHYLFICPYFHAERIRFVKKKNITYIFPVFLKIKQLLTTTCKSELRKVALFISVIPKTF